MTRKRAAAAPSTPRCVCRTGPLIVATFRRERLVDVVRQHWRRDGCPMPDDHIDPADYAPKP